MGRIVVVSVSCLLILVAGIAHADKPCSLYDVTTLRRSTGNIEVHSRTDAVGLKTNVRDFLGFEDPLEGDSLSCLFNGTEVCSGWQLDGFELTHWHEEDPVDGWTKVTPRNVTDNEIHISEEEVHNQRFYEYDFEDKSNYAILFRSRNDSAFFISTRGRVAAEGLQFTFDSSNHMAVYYKTKKFYDRDYYYRPYGRYYNTQASRYFEENGYTISSVALPHDNQDPTVLLRKEDDRICIWMKNTDHSKDCLFTDSANSNTFSVILDSSDTKSDFEVLKRGGSAMQLLGTSGSASAASLDLSLSRNLCISLRYFLMFGEFLKVQFIADDDSQKILHSTMIQGTGDVVSKQFSMIYERTNYQYKIKITFRTESANSFELRSSRKCSANDVDVIIIKKDDLCNGNFGSSTCVNSYTDYAGVGFSTRCSPWLDASVGSNEKCHHGGQIMDGWCRCLPGFIGTVCEKACPPGRFGVDCRGACVDDRECKGTSLATPGQPFECARGFTGSGCNETCGYGFYGPNCRLKCGQCLYGTCNEFTGICTGPCRQGYKTRTCQEQLASFDRIKILSTSFDLAVVSVDVTQLSNDEMKDYPFIKVLFRKDEPGPWTNMVLPLTSTITNFTLDNLEYGENYAVNAVLVHKSGGFYQKDDETIFSTDCIVSKFDQVDLIAEETKLNITWKMIEDEKYPCKIRGFLIDVFLPESDNPIKGYASPQSRNAIVEAVLLRYGTFRLGVQFTTPKSEWTYHKFSSSRKIDISRNFEIIGKSTRSIDFSWSSSDGLAAEVVDCKHHFWAYSNTLQIQLISADCLGCSVSTTRNIQNSAVSPKKPEPILCPDKKLDNKKQLVRSGDFSLRGLIPFTTYKCSLETSQMEASTITEQDVPSSSPQPHDQPVQATNTTASIQWKNADCLDINGIPKGFRIELWRGNINEATTTASTTTLKKLFNDLLPETSYEVKIYIINQIGWNAAKFLSIPFKTKSTTPNAVTNLVVYKRTRHDLWLRWVPPESDSRATAVITYKVTASSPGMEERTSETAPVQCSTWPEYFCHQLRSLVPDTEYTIQVQAKNNKVDLFGPSTVTKGITKVGVPDLPVNVHIQNRTANSAVLAWEIPVMLNSNPKFFVLTLEQTDENSSQEKPTDSLEQKIFITEGKRIYEAKFDQLNPATTYVATIATGLQGQKMLIQVNTPPKDPPAPPAPLVKDSSDTQLILHGIQNDADSLKTLSGYLLLVTTNHTLGSNHGITNDDVAAAVVSQFTDSFFVAQEFSADLTEEVFSFASEPAVNGNFSLIQNTPLDPGQKYGFALAAVATYCGAHAVTVSPVTFLPE